MSQSLSEAKLKLDAILSSVAKDKDYEEFIEYVINKAQVELDIIIHNKFRKIRVLNDS